MELCFEKKSTNIFAGRLHMVKSSAETVEAVQAIDAGAGWPGVEA